MLLADAPRGQPYARFRELQRAPPLSVLSSVLCVSLSLGSCVRFGGARGQLSPWPTLRCAPPLSLAVFRGVVPRWRFVVRLQPPARRDKGHDSLVPHSALSNNWQYKAVCPLAEGGGFLISRNLFF